ncbi:Protein PTHB1 [Goodea atripinnis]
MLRIFSPNANKLSDEGSADAQLLEVQLQNAIIQVEVGKFVSCSEVLHLAVLHPRKLSVYSVSGTAGNVEHGDQYQLKLVYEHNLQRTACNMTYGTFGGVTGSPLICLVSIYVLVSTVCKVYRFSLYVKLEFICGHIHDYFTR